MYTPFEVNHDQREEEIKQLFQEVGMQFPTETTCWDFIKDKLNDACLKFFVSNGYKNTFYSLVYCRAIKPTESDIGNLLIFLRPYKDMSNFLIKTCIDPTSDNHRVMEWAVLYEHPDIIDILLNLNASKERHQENEKNYAKLARIAAQNFQYEISTNEQCHVSYVGDKKSFEIFTKLIFIQGIYDKNIGKIAAEIFSCTNFFPLKCLKNTMLSKRAFIEKASLLNRHSMLCKDVTKPIINNLCLLSLQDESDALDAQISQENSSRKDAYGTRYA